MSVLVDFLSVVMDLGCMGTYFFALQFKTWYDLLKREIEDVMDPTRDEDVLMSDEPPNRKTTVF